MQRLVTMITESVWQENRRRRLFRLKCVPHSIYAEKRGAERAEVVQVGYHSLRLKEEKLTPHPGRLIINRCTA